MDGDAFANASGFFDGGAKFGFGVLKRSGEMAVTVRVWASFVHFDEVSAFFELLANDGNEFGGVVGVRGVGEDMLLRIVTIGVFVAAENVHGVATDAEARARDCAVIDSVANGGVGGASAFSAHVALGGEAGHEIVARSERGDNGALGDGLFNGLQIFGTGVKEKMNVNVNEAGEKRGVAEVEKFGALRMLYGGADFDDALVLDENFAGSEELAGFDVEEARRVKDDGMFCGGSSGLSGNIGGERVGQK